MAKGIQKEFWAQTCDYKPRPQTNPETSLSVLVLSFNLTSIGRRTFLILEMKAKEITWSSDW